MKTAELNGLAVFSIAGGEKAGAVARVYVDGPAKRVAGFAVRGEGGLLADAPEFKVDVAEVRSLGADALMLADQAAILGTLTNAAFGTLLDAEEMVGRAVLSDAGRERGRVASVLFDPGTFSLTHLELSLGFLKDPVLLPLADVIALGRDFIVVKDAVLVDPPADQPSS